MGVSRGFSLLFQATRYINLSDPSLTLYSPYVLSDNSFVDVFLMCEKKNPKGFHSEPQKKESRKVREREREREKRKES